MQNINNMWQKKHFKKWDKVKIIFLERIEFWRVEENQFNNLKIRVYKWFDYHIYDLNDILQDNDIIIEKDDNNNTDKKQWRNKVNNTRDIG